MSVITIQPAPDRDGFWSNPNPFHIDTETLDCAFGRGTPEITGEDAPWRLIGFQEGWVNKIVLNARNFVADPLKALGLVPVFSDGHALFTVSEAIIRVRSNA